MASELRQLADAYEELTGEQIFCFTSCPKPGQNNYVFQEESFTTRAAALEYMKAMLFRARLKRGLESGHDVD